MNILFCGDVMGRSGKTAVAKYLPLLKQQYQLDFIVVNADNASGGFGLNQQSCLEIFQAGANVITGGDHIWDNKEANNLLATNKNILRPLNFPASSPGNGFGIFAVSSTKKILVLHLMGQATIKAVFLHFFLKEETRFCKKKCLLGHCEIYLYLTIYKYRL